MKSLVFKTLFVASLLTAASAKASCPPEVRVRRRGPIIRVEKRVGVSIERVANVVKTSIPRIFRGFRSGHEIYEEECKENGINQTLQMIRFSLPHDRPNPLPRVQSPGIPEASFFERMPMDNWRTPTDGRFGVSRSGGRRRHKGIDMHAPEGTPIYAVAAGKVIRAWNTKPKDKDGGYGNYIILEHDQRDSSGFPFWTYYTHMRDNPEVKKGDRVSSGQMLGRVGRTPIGRFTNPHNHFEVRLGDGSELGKAVCTTPFGPFHRYFTEEEGAF